MKNLNFMIVALLLMIPSPVIPSGTPPPEASLSGRITDKKTGEALAGVIVYFPDLKTGTVLVANDDSTLENGIHRYRAE